MALSENERIQRARHALAIYGERKCIPAGLPNGCPAFGMTIDQAQDFALVAAGMSNGLVREEATGNIEGTCRVTSAIVYVGQPCGAGENRLVLWMAAKVGENPSGNPQR